MPATATRAALAPAPGPADAVWRSPVLLPAPVSGTEAVAALQRRGAVAATAAANGYTRVGLEDLLREDRTAWIGASGRVFFRDPARAHSPAAARRAATAAAELPYASSEVFSLHSNPGSQRTLYLDFDGGTVTGTQWNRDTGRRSLVATPYDTDGKPSSFGAAERALIQEAWLRVSDDYAPFDIDVTTQAPGAAQIERSSSSDQVYGMVAMVTSSPTIESVVCGGVGVTGVAYLDVFDDVDNTYSQPAWGCTATYGDLIDVSETISHEVGHTFGLSHDGNASVDYYGGQGGWGPIMGSSYVPIIQWSDGWYAGADNHEDDVAMIAAGGAPYRADEAGATVDTAAPLRADPAYIGRRTDVDVWSLGTCSGPVTVTAEPAPYSPDLDIRLTLLDSSGTEVTRADPVSAALSDTVSTGMEASVTQSLASGAYYASIDGVGRGTKTTGYDDYGSLGAYTLAVTGCTAEGAPPLSPPGAPAPISVARGAIGGPRTITVRWTQPDSASAVTGYQVRIYQVVGGSSRVWDDRAVAASAYGASIRLGRGTWQVAVRARSSAGYGPYSARSRSVRSR